MPAHGRHSEGVVIPPIRPIVKAFLTVICLHAKYVTHYYEHMSGSHVLFVQTVLVYR